MNRKNLFLMFLVFMVFFLCCLLSSSVFFISQLKSQLNNAEDRIVRLEDKSDNKNSGDDEDDTDVEDSDNNNGNGGSNNNRNGNTPTPVTPPTPVAPVNPPSNTKAFSVVAEENQVSNTRVRVKGNVARNVTVRQTAGNSSVEFSNNDFKLTLSPIYESGMITHHQFRQLGKPKSFSSLGRYVAASDVVTWYYTLKSEKTTGTCNYIDLQVPAPCGQTFIVMPNTILIAECRANNSSMVERYCDDIMLNSEFTFEKI